MFTARYGLGLYIWSRLVPEGPHKTALLCIGRDRLSTAHAHFRLCSQHFSVFLSVLVICSRYYRSSADTRQCFFNFSMWLVANLTALSIGLVCIYVCRVLEQCIWLELSGALTTFYRMWGRLLFGRCPSLCVAHKIRNAMLDSVHTLDDSKHW